MSVLWTPTLTLLFYFLYAVAAGAAAPLPNAVRRACAAGANRPTCGTIMALPPPFTADFPAYQSKIKKRAEITPTPRKAAFVSRTKFPVFLPKASQGDSLATFYGFNTRNFQFLRNCVAFKNAK